MTMPRMILTALALGVLALVGPADCVLAATRPFRCVGAITLNLPSGVGSGVATHLGRVTGTGVVVQPGEARVTLEAANGDQVELVAHYMSDGSGGWAGTYEITGGTGRFADATGSGTLEAELNPDGTFAADAEGRISY